MSYNYLPTSNLQYFLTKLKEKFLTIKQAREAEAVEGKNIWKTDDIFSELTNFQGGTHSYDNSTKILTITSANSVLNSGSYIAAARIGELLELYEGLDFTTLTFPLIFSYEIKADKTCDYKAGFNASDGEIINLTTEWVTKYQTIQNSTALSTKEFHFYSYDTSNPTVQIKNFMLCTLDEWNKSHDYEPYYIPLKDAMFRREEQRVLGAKNLGKNDAVSQTIGDVTFTVNSDKTITVTWNTKTTSQTNLTMYSNISLPIGEYIMSGCSVTSDVRVFLWDSTDSVAIGESMYTNPEPHFSITSENVNHSFNFMIALKRNQEPATVTVYPMIRLASDPDDTYQPYAKTNAELTEDVKKTVLIGTLTAGQTSITFTNDAITSTARVEAYTEDVYIAMESIERSGTTLTLIFPEQSSNVRVKVVIVEDHD